MLVYFTEMNPQAAGGRRIRALNVAEKNSVARELCRILGGGVVPNGNPPVGEFPYRLLGNVDVMMVVTAVRGHLMGLQFGPEYRGQWDRTDPAALYAAPVVKSVGNDMGPIANNLRRLARTCDWLILWLDCDREGEAIAYEVIQVCREAKPGLDIHRANFSALTQADLTRACRDLARPNPHLAAAVDARQEIDLRIGPGSQIQLQGDQWRIYELIARHFLACVAPDAIGAESKIEVTVGDETFHATGLTVVEENWLEVYPYVKWKGTSDELPPVALYQRVKVTELVMSRGMTEPPELLSEAELIDLMDKNHI
ncbi:hypothetical protein FOL47_010706, partial [Perkinsus chesapeaki]